MVFRTAATLDELWVGDMVGRVVDGQRVVLLRLEDGVCAYADRCPHLGVPLSDGDFDGEVLTCRAHHYRYDARTGQGINPRTVCLTALPVELRGDAVLVDVGEPSRGGPR